MSAYFVTAIGTGVGKTFTTCALLHAARAKGIQAHGFKPVISGWDESDDTDTAQIIKAGGAGDVPRVSPWRYHAPLSPHRAAALEQEFLDVDGLIDWTNEQKHHPGLTLIETVGGVMVPLNDERTTIDWMREVGLPVVLVTGTYLGSISHTLTALAVLEQEGIKVAALVVNESAESSVDFAEAQAGLAPFITTIPLRIFQPRVSSWQDATQIASLLERL